MNRPTNQLHPLISSATLNFFSAILPSLFVQLARSGLVAAPRADRKIRTEAGRQHRLNNQLLSLLLLKLFNLSTLLSSISEMEVFNYPYLSQTDRPGSSLEIVAIIRCHPVIELILSAVPCYRLFDVFLSIFGDLVCTASGWHMYSLRRANFCRILHAPIVTRRQALFTLNIGT